MSKAAIAWERCVTKQARSATSQRRSPTQNRTPVDTSPASSFKPRSEQFGRAVGESHMACMCVPDGRSPANRLLSLPLLSKPPRA